MIINAFFVIVVAFVIGKMAQGHKRGMVKEIISFVSLIVISIVIALLANGLKNYLQKEMVGLVVTIILLGIIMIAHSFLSVFFFTAKVVSKLPIVHWLDKTMGLVVGALEAILFLWVLYFFTIILDMGTAEEWILKYTKENTVLLWFYQHNYLVRFLEQAGVANLVKLF